MKGTRIAEPIVVNSLDRALAPNPIAADFIRLKNPQASDLVDPNRLPDQSINTVTINLNVTLFLTNYELKATFVRDAHGNGSYVRLTTDCLEDPERLQVAATRLHKYFMGPMQLATDIKQWVREKMYLDSPHEVSNRSSSGSADLCLILPLGRFPNPKEVSRLLRTPPTGLEGLQLDEITYRDVPVSDYLRANFPIASLISSGKKFINN